MKKEHHGTKNLIPYDQLTEEQQKELVRKGGKASGKARKKKKELKERIGIALDYLTKVKAKQAPDEEIAEVIKSIGYDTFIILKAIEKGDLQALDRFWDRLYGKAVQPTEDITPRDEPDIKAIFLEMRTRAEKELKKRESKKEIKDKVKDK